MALVNERRQPNAVFIIEAARQRGLHHHVGRNIEVAWRMEGGIARQLESNRKSNIKIEFT
jgi:hypothetical protein